MREYFDDELLVSAGRRLEPTPLGMSLISPVRDALQRARAVMLLRPSFDPATASRRFVVSASDYAVNVLLARVVAALAHSAPGIKIEICRPPADIEDTFERGTIDLIVLPEQYATSLDHPSEELLRDGHVCLTCASNPVNAGELTMDRYLELGHVVVRLGREGSIAFEEWFLPRYGQQRRIECVVDHFSALPMLLMGTARIATVHERLARDMTARFALKVLPSPFQMPDLVERLVWPRYLDLDPAHRWLRDNVIDRAAELRDSRP